MAEKQPLATSAHPQLDALIEHILILATQSNDQVKRLAVMMDARISRDDAMQRWLGVLSMTVEALQERAEKAAKLR